MRTFSVAVCVLAAVGTPNMVYAQGRVQERVQGKFVERIQDLDLTDTQEAELADIQKEHRPKVQEAAKTLGTLVKEEVARISEVLTPEQREKVQALREKDDRPERREECLSHALANLKELDLTDAEMSMIGEIRSDVGPRRAKAVKELQDLLTEEQKKARADALAAGKKRREVLQALELTGAQKEKVASLGKELRTAVGDEVEQLQGAVTAGQAEKLQELKDERKERVRDRMAYRIANAQDLGLTDEQKSKIADIRQEYRPRIQEAGNKLRAAIREELGQIAAVIKG